MNESSQSVQFQTCLGNMFLHLNVMPRGHLCFSARDSLVQPKFCGIWQAWAELRWTKRSLAENRDGPFGHHIRGEETYFLDRVWNCTDWRDTQSSEHWRTWVTNEGCTANDGKKGQASIHRGSSTSLWWSAETDIVKSHHDYHHWPPWPVGRNGTCCSQLLVANGWAHYVVDLLFL